MQENEPRETSDDPVLTTTEFRMQPAAFALRMFTRFGRGWLVAVAVLVFASAICAVLVDWRFLVLTLMLVLIVTPMVLTTLYYTCGLRRECFLNVMPHTVTAHRGNVTVRIRVSYPPAEDSVGQDSSATGESLEATAEAPEEEWREWSYAAGSLGRYTVEGDGVCVPFLPPLKGFLWLPASAFDDPADFRIFLNRLGIGENPETSEEPCVVDAATDKT